jgi:hypothetical protein
MAFRVSYSCGSFVEIAKPVVPVVHVTVNVGGAASAGKALARISAAITVAVDASKMIRLMEATSFSEDGDLCPDRLDTTPTLACGDESPMNLHPNFRESL